MKKLLTLSFLTLGIILISGCSFNEQKPVDNSAMTEQITALQEQMSGLSFQMETLKSENEQLKKEGEELKKENDELKNEIKLTKENTTILQNNNSTTNNFKETKTEIDKKDNLHFVNSNGKYEFDYTIEWESHINKFASKNSLFGPNATNESSIGGVEVFDYSDTLESYINYAENNMEIDYISKKRITINGIDAIYTEYKGFPVSGFSVILKYNDKIYNVFINNKETSVVKYFDDLVYSFKFL